MSLLQVGTACTACGLIDFLPFTCSSCQSIFCTSHIHQHACSGVDTPSTEAGPSERRRRAPCLVEECDRPSLEAVAGVDGDREGVASEIRCAGCGGAFCVSHRAQAAHACTAPLDYDRRHASALERQARAREVIAQNFPQHVGRTIPKPPPPKDVVRAGPAPSQTSTTTSTPAPAIQFSDVEVKRPKTIAEKTAELQLRKLRSLATPLIPLSGMSAADADRRFFEWGVDLAGHDVEAWSGGAAMKGALTRVWVATDVPCGKILDVLVAKSRAKRAGSQLRMVNLISKADASRQVVPIDLSQPARTIAEGSILTLTPY